MKSPVPSPSVQMIVNIALQGLLRLIISQDTPIINLLFACSQHLNRDPRRMVLAYDGRILDPILSPAALALKDGNILDILDTGALSLAISAAK